MTITPLPLQAGHSPGGVDFSFLADISRRRFDVGFRLAD
jgi:hypothetical protein